jgi:hypothetical protein
MHRKSWATLAVCMAALTGISAGPAFAGEVKGPPGPPGGEFTAARSNSNSICSYSGLNDFVNGHTSFHVQSFGIDVSGKGDPANPREFNPGDICQGPSNPNRVK